MPEPGDKIAQYERRAVVDDLLLKGMPPKRICRYLFEMYSDRFTEKAITDYRANFFRNENGIVNQIIKASQELADHDPPPTSDREVLASYFTFKRTKEDLDLIYERIRALREIATKMPYDDSYDKRIVLLLAQAEAIRNRVFRHQYEQIRKAVVLNIGKKICMAAINVFLAYVPSDKRKEAVERFDALVKPMLGLTAIPDEPDDISEIKSDLESDEQTGEIPPDGTPQQ